MTGVGAVIARALGKEPDARFPDIDAFADALAAVADVVELPTARPPSAVSGPANVFTPAALARTEVAVTVDPRRPRSRLGWAALATASVLVVGAAAWVARSRNPLAVDDPVLACPVLEATENGAPAPWLGAAAAFLLCDDAAPVLGGFHRHVRSPGDLLALPRRATETPASDPYETPEARSRSLFAARRFPAHLDGAVTVRGWAFEVTAVVRAADGRELGSPRDARAPLRSP